MELHCIHTTITKNRVKTLTNLDSFNEKQDYFSYLEINAEISVALIVALFFWMKR